MSADFSPLVSSLKTYRLGSTGPWWSSSEELLPNKAEHGCEPDQLNDLNTVDTGLSVSFKGAHTIPPSQPLLHSQSLRMQLPSISMLTPEAREDPFEVMGAMGVIRERMIHFSFM